MVSFVNYWFVYCWLIFLILCSGQEKFRHYQQHIPVSVLSISNKDFPELKLKAWTNRVMSAYIAVCMEQACNRFGGAGAPPRMALAAAVCKTLSQFLLAVEMAPRYLTQEQADHMNNLCLKWLDNWHLRMKVFVVILFPAMFWYNRCFFLLPMLHYLIALHVWGSWTWTKSCLEELLKPTFCVGPSNQNIM